MDGVTEMVVETFGGLVIISFVALVMILIGVSQMLNKDAPVGFYNLIDPPKKEEITDMIAWNKQHGIMWIAYGVMIELGFWLGGMMPITALEMLFMMGGIVFPLPLMVMRHRSLVKKYRKV